MISPCITTALVNFNKNDVCDASTLFWWRVYWREGGTTGHFRWQQ